MYGYGYEGYVKDISFVYVIPFVCVKTHSPLYKDVIFFYYKKYEWVTSLNVKNYVGIRSICGSIC